MWPVVDDSSGEWIGWLGKASFELDSGNLVSYDNFMAHLDWGSGNTGVAYDQGFMCLDCQGEWHKLNCAASHPQCQR
jgi:hypothetical protein